MKIICSSLLFHLELRFLRKTCEITAHLFIPIITRYISLQQFKVNAVLERAPTSRRNTVSQQVIDYIRNIGSTDDEEFLKATRLISESPVLLFVSAVEKQAIVREATLPVFLLLLSSDGTMQK